MKRSMVDAGRQSLSVSQQRRRVRKRERELPKVCYSLAFECFFRVVLREQFMDNVWHLAVQGRTYVNVVLARTWVKNLRCYDSAVPGAAGFSLSWVSLIWFLYVQIYALVCHKYTIVRMDFTRNFDPDLSWHLMCTWPLFVVFRTQSNWREVLPFFWAVKQ